MGRVANGTTVKINTEISKKEDNIIRDYQIAKVKRFGEKVTKNEATKDVIEYGTTTAVKKMSDWEKEIQEFKNQKQCQKIKN